jgi:hypothetical protein
VLYRNPNICNLLITKQVKTKLLRRMWILIV